MVGALHIVRFAGAPRMPWRNGGGETVEVAAHPRGAAVDAFGWRVSLATISADGPFSTFLHVDRTLTVVDGGGLILQFGDRLPKRLHTADAPHRFPGEVPCRARLVDSPTIALNAMVARGAFDCVVTPVDAGNDLPSYEDAATVLVCSAGVIETALGTLGPQDALVAPTGAVNRLHSVPPTARGIAVSLWPVDGRAGTVRP